MADTIARDADRLPWLTDEKTPRKPSGRLWTGPLLVVGMVAIALFSFWFGMTRSWSPQAPATVGQPEAVTAIPLPEPTEPVAPQSEIAPMRQVEPAPAPAPVVIRMQEDVRPSVNPAPPLKRVESPVPAISAEPSPPVKEAVPERKPLQFSNPWDSSAASGRMVRIGTYSSLRQGKQAWSKLARSFPGMKKLPAVVTDIPSLRNGRVYYRLQIGTTSQAHSEVLCQRMRAIGQSCIVVDLAGARKGSGDERQPADV
jgi:hypothetical protein